MNQAPFDQQAAEASKFLQTFVIPAFVAKLDGLDVLPIDSRGLTTEMHAHGINARYLGMSSL